MLEKTTGRLAEFEQDIDYLMHVEHELPMELYTQLEPLKADLAKLMATHADATAKTATMQLKYKIAAEIKEKVVGIVLDDVKKVDSHDW